ncbi:conserved hypothetical protein [Cellulomonas flavigena DSM 20109]|uniref:Uncharacterized protein n=1 Tax=Cellulomonas flavigena (strain ATCC 482 / DSM 20109 / BCRC 11376 / JCM 18109 / NBRC 3775 / NCIMB 8073 / NRS 134) TaxID=446466 RepID=D5UHM0_CELFN|nr:hypothetical protein [Cellulomonas flavigena]ADG75341.1 conserved hypothetical protein [Cellulomonas flavigena DSM 20109]
MTTHAAGDAVGTGLTRRTVLRIGAGVAAVAALPVGAARAAASAPGTMPAGPAGALPSVPLEGTGLDVALHGGDPATVLTHVARRFHYEVRTVRAAVGQRTEPGASPRALAHADGTAVHLDPGASPVGASGTLEMHEVAALRAVLADCDGLVAWGGDDAEPCEGHLRLAVAADDPAVARLADRLAGRHGAAADLAARGPEALARAEQVRVEGAVGS